MNKFLRFSVTCFFSIALMMLMLVFNTGVIACPDKVEVNILGINDFHGQLDYVGYEDGKRIGSAPYLAAYLRKSKATYPNTLLVHSGDIVGGSSPISSLFKDEPTINFLNKLGFNVGTPGNHEFDRGKDEMLRLLYGDGSSGTRFFEKASFPYTSANIVDKKTGKHILPPYVIQEIDGVKIGFIGITTTYTPSLVVEGAVKNLTFLDEAKSISYAVKELKKQGVNTTIVLAHEGGFQQESGEITGAIVDIIHKLESPVDVIFTGHNNQYLNGTVNNTLVLQANQYGMAFARAKLCINRTTGKADVKAGEIHRVYQDGISPDPQIQELVQQCREEAGPRLKQQLGTCAHALEDERTECCASSLGCLLADAIRYKLHTDIAFMNTGGIRGSLPAGKITWGGLYSCQPFGNALIKVDMTGEQIRQVLNQQYQNDKKHYYLDPSGITFKYDPARPKGNQIVDIRTWDSKGGKALMNNRMYSVGINNFLASGGVGFSLFREGKNRVIGSSDLEAYVEYVSQLPEFFSVAVDKRIQLAG